MVLLKNNVSQFSIVQKLSGQFVCDCIADIDRIVRISSDASNAEPA